MYVKSRENIGKVDTGRVKLIIKGTGHFFETLSVGSVPDHS